MRLIIQRDRLLQSISEVSGAINNKTTKTILTTIKVMLKENGLELTGSDSDISIQAFIPIEESGDEIIEVKKLGAVCLNARLFSEIVRKLPNDTVEIEVKENEHTTISSGKSIFTINGLSSEEYPNLPSIENAVSYELSISTVKTLIKQTKFAVAKNELRPILTGVNWKIDNDQLNCAATDSHRLSKKVIDFSSKNSAINIVIPGKSLEKLNSLLPETTENVEIFFTSNQILFKTKNILFFSRLLEGNYPDVERLIPRDIKTKVNLNTKELWHVVDRASILARENKTNIVKMTVANGQIEISSNTPEIGNVVESIQTSEFSGEGMTVSFNSGYILEAIKAIDDEECSILFSDAMRPFIITGTTDTSIMQLILPVRTA